MEAPYLPRLHKEMLIIYHKIEEICNKHGLKFFVVGGTLLGAVVWKGYIPWDDDLDVAMPRDDYDKFIDICLHEQDDKFFLHHTLTDDDYWLPFAKLRLNNTIFMEEARKNVNSHAGIYVDIFPFDYASSTNGLLSKIKWRWITYINNHINSRVTKRKKVSKSSRVLDPIFCKVSVKKLSLHRDRMMRSFDHGKRNFFVDLAGGRRLDNSYFPINSIFPLQRLTFEDTTVISPFDPNGYLLQLYTERYKTIPPKEKQITHKPVLIRFEDGEEYRYEE